MSKFTCLVLCALAASLSHAYAVTTEEKAVFLESLKPVLEECSKTHGVSHDDVKNAKEIGNADGLKPCFMGCLLKKTGVMNAEGKLDEAVALEKLKKFVKNSEDVAKFEAVGKTCIAVNDQPVNDEAEGCERAQLLVACLLKHRNELPLTF